MARRRRRGNNGGNGDQGMGGAMQPINAGLNEWNENAGDWAQGAIDYGQGNDFTNSANDYIQNTLSGGQNNRWADQLFGDLNDVNMDESNQYLRDFLGGSGGSGGRGGGGGLGSGYSGVGGTGGRKVKIQDSTMGKGAFADTAQWFLDRDARLNPADDPTLKPYIDAMQQEALESYQGMSNDLDSELSGRGLWGGSRASGLKQMARDDAQENITNATAGVYQGSRDNAINKMMEMLGLGNQRDIAQGNIDAQMEAANMAASSSNSANASNRYNADQDRRLQAISMMMQGGQFGLGMKGDMANMLQGAQDNALNAGIGYGELGMSGYDRANNMGQLGLGALSQLGGNVSSYYNSQYGRQASERANQFARERYDNQLPWDNANQMIDLLRNMGSLSGEYDSPGYVQSPGPSGSSTPPWLDALLAGGGAGIDQYYGR